jgi:hypothetical protein
MPVYEYCTLRWQNQTLNTDTERRIVRVTEGTEKDEVETERWCEDGKIERKVNNNGEAGIEKRWKNGEEVDNIKEEKIFSSWRIGFEMTKKMGPTWTVTRII